LHAFFERVLIARPRTHTLGARYPRIEQILRGASSAAAPSGRRSKAGQRRGQKPAIDPPAGRDTREHPRTHAHASKPRAGL